MSNIHIIISKNKIDGILKERYLGFREFIDGNSHYYCYYRYDEKNFITIDKNKYLISKDFYSLIKKYANHNELFFSTCCLFKYENEEYYINKFIKDNRISKVNLTIPLKFNELYQVIFNN